MAFGCALNRSQSLEACVDLCNKVNDRSSAAEVEHYLARSWQSNIGISLRAVFALLDVHNGKASTTTALYALHWMLNNHPLTLLANLKNIVAFGCIRDLALLLMVVRCSLAEGITFDEWQKKKVRPQKGKTHSLNHDEFYAKARKVILQGDALKLHQKIVSLYVDALQTDMEAMRCGKDVSLFSKWLPSQGSYLNRTTRLFDDVAMHIYIRDKEGTHEKGTDRRRPLIRARNYLRQVYISPLRNHAEVVERLMSDGKWDKITYTRVPSKCMSRNAAHFSKHDSQRFVQFACDVAEGKEKGNAKMLKPHRICFHKKRISNMPVEALEAQWQAYVRSMKERDKLGKAVAICDVGRSTSGLRKKVAVSLSMLIASLAEPMWKEHLITFAVQPRLHRIEGRTLMKKVRNIQGMGRSNNTNFDLLFELILNRARQHNLSQSDMPTRLFVFSGKPFDEAFPKTESTAFEQVKANYSAYGYEMPQIVFWNLSKSHGLGIQVTDMGTVLVSGYHQDLLKLVLEDDGLTDEKLRESSKWRLGYTSYRRYNVLMCVG